MSAEFAISGMTCNGCRGKVEKALRKVSPDVAVTLDPPRAVFSGAPAPLSAIAEALRAVGTYSASPVMGAAAPAVAKPASWIKTYYPLLLIAAYIAVAALAGGGHSSATAWMNHFMAGFFLVFSFFKLLDLEGFASAYAGYDLLAARAPAYGKIYPFLELALGLAYLFGVAPVATNLATLILMGFGALGVWRALSERRTIRCACLGTVLNLPMSTVTLAENGLMAAMALMMLVFGPLH